MSERTELGQIGRCEFGLGGYQEAMIGISFTLSGKGWGVGDFWGEWAIDRSEHAKWTEQSRIEALGNTVMRINKLLTDAKAQNVAQLVGKPIEATFDGQILKSWRILTEVL